MRKKKDYLSDGLYALRQKHREREEQIGSEPEDIKAKDTVELKTTSANSHEEVKSFCNTKLNRGDERKTQKISQIVEQLCLDLERDLIHAETSLVGLSEKNEKLMQVSSELKSILATLNDIKNPTVEEQGFLRETEATLHQLKLSYYRVRAKLNALNDVKNSETNFSIIPEINSLTPVQLCKLGLFLGLPVIIAIIFGFFLVCWAIIVSMGGV